MLRRVLILGCFCSALAACGDSGNSQSGSTDNGIDTSTITDTNVNNGVNGSSINTAPVATAISIVDNNGGEVQAGDILTGRYTYNDAEGDLEGESLYQWLRVEVEAGSNTTQARLVARPIPGANQRTYRVSADDVGYRLEFEVTPVAQTGMQQGQATTANPSGDSDSGSPGITQIVELAPPLNSAPIVTSTPATTPSQPPAVTPAVTPSPVPTAVPTPILPPTIVPPVVPTPVPVVTPTSTAAPTPTPTPVSYTHLTLPTICSV